VPAFLIAEIAGAALGLALHRAFGPIAEAAAPVAPAEKHARV